MELLFSKINVKSYFILTFLCYLIIQNSNLCPNAICNENSPQEQDNVNPEESNIVGKIEEYTITRQELEKKLISELQPNPYRLYSEQTKPYDANSMLLIMLGEKAVAMEARKDGLLEDDTIQNSVARESIRQKTNLWIQYNANKERSKITATEDEIDKQMKADPKMDHAKAKSAVEAAKTNKILDQCYETLYKRLEVKKETANFTQAIKIHERLLKRPVKPRPASYIRDYQVKEELTEEEKNLALATFRNGKVTLEQWFEVLCDYSPPSRPRNLDTEEGIEQLLDKTIIKPLIIAEVEELGLDKNPLYLQQMRDYENKLLLSSIRNKKNAEVNEPSSEEIQDFFNKNKEFFIQGRMMKIDQVWCKDLESAKLAKKELDSGKDFNDVKKEYSLYPESQPYITNLNGEGYFWHDLWSVQQDTFTDPIKGFHNNGIKWRIVKIMEKNQGKQQEYSKELETTAKYLMMSELAIKYMDDYCVDTLKKYPYEIYTDKIRDIDPMNIK